MTPADADRCARYKKIVARPEAIEQLFVDAFFAANDTQLALLGADKFYACNLASRQVVNFPLDAPCLSAACSPTEPVVVLGPAIGPAQDRPAHAADLQGPYAHCRRCGRHAGRPPCHQRGRRSDGALLALPTETTTPPDKPATSVVQAEVREVRRFRGQGPFHSVGLSQDGKVVATATFGSLWEADTGRPITSVNGGARYEKGILSPDGSRVAFLTVDRQASIWDISPLRGKSPLLLSAQPLRDAAFTPDGEGLFSCGLEEGIRLWSIPTRKVLLSYAGHKGGVNCLALSRKGDVLVSGGLKDGKIRVWNVQTRAQRTGFSGHKGQVLSVGISRDGTKLFSAGSDALCACATSERGHRSTA